MKKVIYALFIVAMSFGNARISFGQIFMDGDSTDWDTYPILTAAPNNEESMFPPEVGATVTDIVDIKYVKAVVIGNILYGYIEFWGGPVRPNGRYERDIAPPAYYESRGYYRLLLDIDNDPYTGWDTAFLEKHHSPVGYLTTVSFPYDPIGAELMFEWNARMNDDWHLGNEGDDANNELNYRGIDCEEYNGQTDTGSTYLIFNMPVLNADSTSTMKREGKLKIDNSDDEILLNDSLTSYWSGHAWGYSFIEFGIELTPFQKYFKNKDGREVLQPGDNVGLSAMVQTSYDDWGIDMSAKGELNIVVGISENESEIVRKFSLYQNYPNPFNPSTKIVYDLSNSGDVSLSIYDVLGRKVSELIHKKQCAGSYSLNWAGSNLSSGIYFYRLEVTSAELKKQIVLSKKMVLMK